ncbi:MAG: hypothetical protein CL927_20150 [Deltaproteobacteria bacterium]|nr:hypothetical protein [Deltaproteobacteria bacterium]HCH63236.1 hypothetical protein [Deltaproteobacteria bacterium]
MSLRFFGSLFVCLTGSACGAGDASKMAPADAEGDSGEASAGDVTWHGDIENLVQSQCVRCHSADGQAPGDFSDVATVELLAEPILAAVEAGTMPPPVSDPSCRPYVGSELMRLDEDEKARLRSWVEGGMPRGEPGGGLGEVLPARLENPDAIIRMPEPYTPTFSQASEPGNEYRCFLLDPSEFAGQYITAIGPEVGEPGLMHHIVLSTVSRDDVDERHLDPQGWECMNGSPGIETDDMIAGFAPGTQPLVLPPGTGLQIPEDSYLLLDMHYFANPDAVGLADQTGVALKLADSVETPVFLMSLGMANFEIGAGDPAAEARRAFPMRTDLDLYTMLPHMHGLGSAYNVKVEHTNGDETCVVEGGYSFDNQITFLLEEPVALAAGDKIDVRCEWDNSGGTEDVRYGERTDEEMCFFFGLVGLRTD